MLSGKRLWQVRRTRYSYNILGLVKKGEIEKAEEVLQSMIDRRVYPDIFAYNALIKGYVLTSDARKAFKTFNNLKKRGLMPSDITYTSMFAVCGRTKSAEILDKVMKEIERQGVSLNTLTFNAMLTAMANCGMVDEVFDEVTKLDKPDIDTYRSLLLACARSSM
ncbi:PREDICTED: pentatricopeptide repeat-containing protein At1g62590-like, partial [Amphimedon queenslandica]